MRKMASVRKIDRIIPHPNADKVEISIVGGWQAITRKGEFKEGDLVIFCEIDSWMPQELAPFLIKDEVKEFKGIAGVRLKTARIRGVLSQGLILPLNTISSTDLNIGDDVSEILGIVKWEAPESVRGGEFPAFIPKTDQERVQNIPQSILESYTHTFEVTEKLDGSSMTVFVNGDQEGVCSRNLIVEGENNFTEAEQKDSIIAKIRQTGLNLAVQGELIGESIQGNHYRILGRRFYVFDIYHIDHARYLSPEERHSLTAQMGLRHVPIVSKDAFLPKSILDSADGKSALNVAVDREGVVFKSNQLPRANFKAISNRWLLGTGK